MTVTTTATIPDRRQGWLQAWLGAVVFALLVTCIQLALIRPSHAQMPFEEAGKGEEPSLIEIDHALTDLLLCEWLTDRFSSLGPRRFYQVLKHLAESNPESGSEELVGAFHVFGHVFHRISSFAGQGGGAALGWSATSSTDSIVLALQERGFTFVPMTEPRVGFSGKMIRGSFQYDVWVGSGHYTFARQEGSEGVTLMCGARETKEATDKRMLEEQTARQIYQKVESRERQPQEWVEAILNEGTRRDLARLANYKWLNVEQIERLAQSDDRGVREALIRNVDAALSTAQIERLLTLRHHESLLRYRYGVLTTAQVNGLLEKAETRGMAMLAGGGTAALEELERTLRTGNEIETVVAFKRLRAITPEVLDLVLRAGNKTAIGHLLRTYDPPYTPELVERMLATDDPDLHIWLVRKDDLPLTRAQYERGVMHPDGDISFWYRGRKDHTPSAELIEQGLTSSDGHIRRSWLANRDVKLTPAQVARALADPSEGVRHAAFARKDIALSPAQLDACLRETDYSVRAGCAGRPELTLTQERFENIVGHSNPNVFRSFVSAKKGQNIDLAPYVRQAVLTASDETLLRMAKLAELPITADDVRTVRYTRNRQVQSAYCTRAPEACPRKR